MDNKDSMEPRPAGVPALLKGGVIVSLSLSFGILALYLTGGLEENGFPDEVRSLLLRLVSYLSLFLTLCSLFALGFAVRLMVVLPRFRSFLGIVYYMLTCFLGSALVILYFFITVTAGGNG